MAIERQEPLPVNPNKPETIEEAEIDKIIELAQPESEDGFVMMEDGSAVLGGEDDMPMNIEFDGNLAEVLDEDELQKISNLLLDGIEKDKSSRKDWEKTYTDGLKYLGMKFDEDRSEPFEGASGVIHPLLGEAVTTFQAQAYKELLPAGGPVKTQVVGDYDSNIEMQAQRFLQVQKIYKPL